MRRHRFLWGSNGSCGSGLSPSPGPERRDHPQARLGWVDKLQLPKRDGTGTWPLSGVVLPWFDGDRPSLVKVRRLGLFKGPKYIEVFRDRPVIYPGWSSVRSGGTLIVCEGEFDALLVAQELAALDVSVITLGSASSQPPPGATDLLCTASRLFVATDGDDAGDRSASKWPAHARRVRPPTPDKDWTEVHLGGFNRLRYLWPGYLCDCNWPRTEPLPIELAKAHQAERRR